MRRVHAVVHRVIAISTAMNARNRRVRAKSGRTIARERLSPRVTAALQHLARSSFPRAVFTPKSSASSGERIGPSITLARIAAKSDRVTPEAASAYPASNCV